MTGHVFTTGGLRLPRPDGDTGNEEAEAQETAMTPSLSFPGLSGDSQATSASGSGIPLPYTARNLYPVLHFFSLSFPPFSLELVNTISQCMDTWDAQGQSRLMAQWQL